MSEEIEYTGQELAEMTLHNNFMLQAQRDVFLGTIQALAEMINPALSKPILEKVPAVLQERFLFYLSEEHRISEALREKLRNELGI